MRLKVEDALEHETRTALNKIIQKHPGVSFSELMNETQLMNGVIAYHLKVLEKADIVRSVRTRGRRCYYSTKVSILKVPMSTSARVLALIKKNPGTFQIAIAKEIDESRQTINYQVNQLLKEGKIWYKIDGKKMLLFARYNT